MSKRVLVAILSASMALLALLGAKAPEDVEQLHKHTKECTEHTRVQCTFTCKHCHGNPWQPIELDMEKGDYDICATKCHKEEIEELSPPIGRDCMLKHHQENVIYNSDDFYNEPRIKLKRNPVGLQLFCDRDNPDRCKILCITCHEPHEGPGQMMRVNEYGRTCTRCHDI